jgi:excisionase family DNA binding protein
MRLEVTTLERRAISITQACESVGVSRRTIYNWMAAGKVQYVRTAGGAVRIFEDSLWRGPAGERWPLGRLGRRSAGVE